MEWIYNPWPWYISGPLIALILFALLWMGNTFGMSSNLRTFCTLCGAGKKSSFFNFNWKSQRWNLLVVLGTLIGGYIAANFLTGNPAVEINTETMALLNSFGFDSAGKNYLPKELFSLNALSSVKNVVILIVGGFLVGFGSRYTGGCTSGHAITGLSNLQLPSLIAVIGFFIGGLLMVHFIFPLIF